VVAEDRDDPQGRAQLAELLPEDLRRHESRTGLAPDDVVAEQHHELGPGGVGSRHDHAPPARTEVGRTRVEVGQHGHPQALEGCGPARQADLDVAHHETRRLDARRVEAESEEAGQQHPPKRARGPT